MDPNTGYPEIQIHLNTIVDQEIDQIILNSDTNRMFMKIKKPIECKVVRKFKTKK